MTEEKQKERDEKVKQYRKEKLRLAKAINLIDEESKCIKNKKVRLGIVYATAVLQDRLEEIREIKKC